MEKKYLKNVVSRAIAYAFATFFLLSFLSIQNANAATLDFSSTTDNYTVGQEFSVGVNVSSPDQSINAVAAEIYFSPDKLELISLSKKIPL